VRPCHILGCVGADDLQFLLDLPGATGQTIECIIAHICSAQVTTMGVARFMLEGVEADDVIATLAVRAVEAGMHVDIASPDKVRGCGMDTMLSSECADYKRQCL